MKKDLIEKIPCYSAFCIQNLIFALVMYSYYSDEKIFSDWINVFLILACDVLMFLIYFLCSKKLYSSKEKTSAHLP